MRWISLADKLGNLWDDWAADHARSAWTVRLAIIALVVAALARFILSENPA